MRIALRQEPQEEGNVAEGGKRERGADEARGPELASLHGVMPEMFVEPRPPDEADAVARLQDRPLAR
jgi:hypothetical protein